MDIYYENQQNYCKQHKLPLFAMSQCSHTYSWVRGELRGKTMTFGEMLVAKYGSEPTMSNYV